MPSWKLSSRNGSKRQINDAYLAQNTHLGANEYKKEVVIVLLTDEQYVVKWSLAPCANHKNAAKVAADGRKDPAESEKANAHCGCFRRLLYRT